MASNAYCDSFYNKNRIQSVSSSPSQPNHDSQKTLQLSLQKEIQQLQEREKKTALASQQVKLSFKQANLLKKHQKHLIALLSHTKKRLEILNNQIDNIDTYDHTLQQEQENQLYKKLSLLPILISLEEMPEKLLIPSNISPPQDTSFKNDPALAIPLLHARLVMSQQEDSQVQQKRNALHQQKTQLDQRAQNTELQRQQQEKQQDTSQEKALIALQANQKAKEELTLSRSLLRKSQHNMQLLTEAIDHLAQKEQETRRRLQNKEKQLKRTHKKFEAHQTENALHDLENGRGLTKGQGLTPVRGILITRWQQPTEAGPATGLTYHTSTPTTVSAPCSGRLLFTGDFRSFGPMVILDCGHSQRFIIAGFGRITARTEQMIKRQSPLGTMPSNGGNLFIQFRHGTHIANPTPFLSSSPS